jgi:hypothetical protein
MADRWDDRDRGRGERWSDEREYNRDRGRRSILAGRNWDDDRERDRDRGWGSTWGESSERWRDRDDRGWDRYREGGGSLTVGRRDFGDTRDYDRDYERRERLMSDRDSERDREGDRYREDYERHGWGRREHFGERDRNYGTSGSAPSFTGAGGTWSAGHSGAAAHEATGGMSAWSGRDRYEDRQRRGGFAGRGPKNYRRADDRICEDVNDRLTRNPDVDAGDVDVTVKEGEVTLAGIVHDRDARRQAEDCAWEVWGVREVHNNLKVQSQENRGVLDKIGDAFRGDNR